MEPLSWVSSCRGGPIQHDCSCGRVRALVRGSREKKACACVIVELTKAADAHEHVRAHACRREHSRIRNIACESISSCASVRASARAYAFVYAWERFGDGAGVRQGGDEHGRGRGRARGRGRGSGRGSGRARGRGCGHGRGRGRGCGRGRGRG
eukprot:2265055-Pleurochrysis_carterae.AAC.5